MDSITIARIVSAIIQLIPDETKIRFADFVLDFAEDNCADDPTVIYLCKALRAVGNIPDNDFVK